MTLPDERYRSVYLVRQFLFELQESKKTPRVPKIIRQQARSLLKHFPSMYDMEEASKQAPEIFSKESWILSFEKGKKDE